MAKTNQFQEILDKALEALAKFINKLKKMDRRFLIMSAVAIVLVIVMVILIAVGVKSNKAEEDTTLSDNSNISEIQSTEDYEEPVFAVGAGTYTVDTGASPYLNMRLAADRDSAIVTTVPNGTELEVMFVDDSEVEADGDYGWGYVEYDGERGWVFMEYLVKK